MKRDSKKSPGKKKRVIKSEADVRATQNRLRRIEGQVRAVQRMLGEDADCEAMVQQIIAAREAMDQVALKMVQTETEECINIPRDKDRTERMRRVLQILFKTVK